MFLILFERGPSADYSEVRTLISKGNPYSAKQELSSQMAGSFADWEGIYLKSVLEFDGEISIGEMEKALLLCEDNCRELISRLLAAYYAAGDYDKVIDLFDEYDDWLNHDTSSFVAYWFTALAYLKQGNSSKAMDLAGKIDGEMRSWKDVLQANCLYLNGRQSDSRRRLNEVIARGKGASMIALYNRTYMDAEGGDMDMALSGFTMLKQNYDDFLGAMEILKMLGGEELSAPDGKAEKLAGVRYTIQLGTFSDEDEALELIKKLKKDGWSAFKKMKYIDGRPYWIVTVGSFPTIENAQNSKKNLEDMLSGSFRVVIME